MTDTPFMMLLSEGEPVRAINVLQIVSASLDHVVLTLVKSNGHSHILNVDGAITAFEYLGKFSMAPNGAPVGELIKQAIAAANPE